MIEKNQRDSLRQSFYRVKCRLENENMQDI